MNFVFKVNINTESSTEFELMNTQINGTRKVQIQKVEPLTESCTRILIIYSTRDLEWWLDDDDFL